MCRVKAASLACAIVAAMIASCSSNDVVRPTMNVSVGQQLIDLKSARDSGALSPQEYESQKAKIIKSVQ